MTFDLLIDIIGWAGALLLLLAYGLLSARRLEGHSSRYQLMNIQGSLCLLANAAYHRAFPSAFVNLIWVIIAGVALVCYARTGRQTSPALEESATPREPTL